MNKHLDFSGNGSINVNVSELIQFDGFRRQVQACKQIRERVVKLPIEVSKQMHKSRDVSLGYEAIVRDCAKVLEKKHAELAKRSYPPPKILLELRDAILTRYGLIEGDGE